MTRLHEALERAKTEATTPTEAPGTTETGPELPEDWQFDGDSMRAPAAAEEAQDAAASVTAASVGPTFRSGDTAAEPAQTPAPPGVQYDFVTEWTADKVIVGPKVSHPFIEQHRRLAAALHHAQAQTGARTVMIASAVESEGKTLTAANVALTLSHSYQKRVLLVDADLRRPSQHELFRLSNRSGLADVLDGTLASGKLPVQRVLPNLWVMTAGKPNSDPMSGLISEEMRAFLAEAVDQFDWVVVDTPPVGLLTDANLLAAMIDLALVVVSAKSTPFPIVRKAIEAIGPERVIGVVLNRADLREATPGYYGYGYGYRYGYSYSSEHRPTGLSRWLPSRKRPRRQA